MEVQQSYLHMYQSYLSSVTFSWHQEYSIYLVYLLLSEVPDDTLAIAQVPSYLPRGSLELACFTQFWSRSLKKQ